MRRPLFGPAAIPLGLGTWVLVLLLLRQLLDRRLPFGEAMFWISHLSFVGWLFALGLMVLWYKLLIRRFPQRSLSAPNSEGGRHAT